MKKQQQPNNMVEIDLFNHTENLGTVTMIKTTDRNGLVGIAYTFLPELMTV